VYEKARFVIPCRLSPVAPSKCDSLHGAGCASPGSGALGQRQLIAASGLLPSGVARNPTETRATAQWLGMAVASQPAQVRLPAGAYSWHSGKILKCVGYGVCWCVSSDTTAVIQRHKKKAWNPTHLGLCCLGLVANSPFVCSISVFETVRIDPFASGYGHLKCACSDGWGATQWADA
jgi:hypothetical protein